MIGITLIVTIMVIIPFFSLAKLASTVNQRLEDFHNAFTLREDRNYGGQKEN